MLEDPGTIGCIQEYTGILKHLTREYLLPSNNQSISLTQLVNPDYFERRAEQEEESWHQSQRSNNPDQVNKALDDSSILPILSEEDIQHEIRDKSIKEQRNLFYRHTGLSNGITYFRALMPITLPNYTCCHCCVKQ